MTQAFVDSYYFIAIFQEGDQWHELAVRVESQISNYSFVTTDLVLCEVLNYFSGFGPEIRLEVSAFIDDVLTDPAFRVVEQTRNIFLEGMYLYKSRLDKGYSLTDCISMNVCRDMEITEVLTHDHHFTQEGFKILL
jgi:predicted nucleic acid-binding protein